MRELKLLTEWTKTKEVGVAQTFLKGGYLTNRKQLCWMQTPTMCDHDKKAKEEKKNPKQYI